MRSLLGSLVVALALAAGAPARADDIVLREGRKIAHVRIVSETYEKVVYEVEGSQQSEPTANVLDVVHDRTSTRYAAAWARWNKGEYAAAFADFKKVVDPDVVGKYKPEEKWMHQYGLYYRAECARRTSDRSALGMYEELLKEYPDTRFYAPAKLGTAKAKLAQGDRAGAKEEFAKLEREASAKKLGKDWHDAASIELAGILEAEGKIDEALSRYRALGSPSDGKVTSASRRALVNGLRLEAKADPKHASQSELGLKQAIDSEYAKPFGEPLDYEVLAAAWNALGDVCVSEGDDKRALLAYLRVALPDEYRSIASERAKALSCAARELEKVKGDDWKARADQLRGELKAVYPQSPWANK